MFILIVEHDHSEWDVTLHTNHKDAEQYIHDLAQQKYLENGGSWQPHGVADWIEYLAENNEHVKLFRVAPDDEPGEQINFYQKAADRKAA